MIVGAMLPIDPSGVLALLLLSAVSGANAIPTSTEGPMIDAARGVTTDTAAEQQLQVTSESSDASTIRIKCTATQMLILVHVDLYNNGGRHVTSPGEVCLGQAKAMQPCTRPCQAFAVSDTEYIIEAELNDCGSMLTISDDSLIYSNELMITPAGNSHVITRKNKAVVHVACHYKRTHLVSSHPHHAIASREKPPSEFSLKLMTDNWGKERSSKTLYLGDMLYIKASYTGSDHKSRRLFVDNCVATLDADVSSVPRYDFIENYGCFTDSRDSNSQFETRVRSIPRHVKGQRSRMKNSFNSLDFKLEAFLFHRDPRNSVFITCKLKATYERSSPTDKACNYANSRWTHADVYGDRDVCSCCETTCNKGQLQQQLQLEQDPVVVYSMETLDVTILTRD